MTKSLKTLEFRRAMQSLRVHPPQSTASGLTLGGLSEELYHAALLVTGGNKARARAMVSTYLDSLFRVPKGFKRVAMINPPPTMIYSHIISLRGSKAGMPHRCDDACRKAGHLYEHKFKSGSAVYGSGDHQTIIIKKRK